MKLPDTMTASVEESASEDFIQREQGPWSQSDQEKLEQRLATDAAYADAYRRIEAAWRAMGPHADSAEVLAYREEAIAVARKSNARRWLTQSPVTRTPWRIAAAAAVLAMVLSVAWQVSPYGYRPGRYTTERAEQRMIELDDHSRVALDAATRVRIRYSPDARIVELQQGQAQFTVAPDPARPFKVIAGGHAIVALGTVFTVEYVDRQVHVAMMEGRVAVNQIELTAGEELRVNPSGQATVIPKADLEAATAWREGKVIFRSETLRDAVRRMNRYSRVQIEVEDEALESRRIYGVFDAGDTQGFVSALERYLPITVDASDSDTLRLRRR